MGGGNIPKAESNKHPPPANIPWAKAEEVMYADDTILFGREEERLEGLLAAVEETGATAAAGRRSCRQCGPPSSSSLKKLGTKTSHPLVIITEAHNKKEA